MSLIIKDLGFSIQERALFQNIEVSFNQGKLISVLGANGVGKTTLFKCLLGILKANSGSIYLDDDEISTFSRQEIAKKIAYIPQVHIPSFDYRVVDVVLMGKTPGLQHFYETPSVEDEEHAYQILEFLDIINLAEKSYRKLSGGERQLVMIAQAIMQDTEIIIMDEPLSSLDFGYQHKIFKFIKKLTREGKLIIVSTHQPEHALTYSDEVLILEKNLDFHFGKPTDVMTKDILERIYNINLIIQTLVDDEGDEHYVCIPR